MMMMTKKRKMKMRTTRSSMVTLFSGEQHCTSSLYNSGVTQTYQADRTT